MTEYLTDISSIQFELTSMCNALCLGCTRTDTLNFNRSKPSIPKKSIMALATISNILNSKSLKNINTIEFCGTIDEPLMHPDFLKIIDLIYNNKPDVRISIHTNGSLRNEKYWSNLALSLNRFKKYNIWFGIDGLEDTHHLYRQNTDFNKIIKNASAFINAGGTASWQYLIFPWNDHQVDQACALAKQLGFSQFKTRNDRSGMTLLDLRDVKIKKEIDKKSNFETSFNKLGGDEYLKYDNYKIDCAWKKYKMIFVSHDNRLWPCCFLANERYSADSLKKHNLEKRLYENYGYEFNDLSVYPIDEILDHRFFKSQLTTSWSSKIGFGETDKIGRCAYTCSQRGLDENPMLQHSTIKIN